MKYTPSEAFRAGVNYVNLALARWLKRIRKSVKRGVSKAQKLLYRISKSSPQMFYHWEKGYMPVT